MTEENGDNKPNQNLGDNKPVAPEPPLPNLEAPEGQQKPEPQDPEFDGWASKVGDLKNAYKEYKNLENRYSGSSAEAKKLSEERKALETEKESIVTELRTVMQRNPQLAEQFQKELTAMSGGQQIPPQPNPIASLAPEDKAVIDQLRAVQQAQAQREIHSFRQIHKDYVKTDEDWSAVKEIAAALDGKRDSQGLPYTLSTALEAAIRVTHPEVIADKAIQKAMSQSRTRDSASEPGDVPSGSSPNSESLDDFEENLIDKLSSYGVSREGYLKRKTQNS